MSRQGASETGPARGHLPDAATREPLLGVTVHTDAEAGRPVGLGIEDLVTLAVRRNPRRAHLLVSSVLGKHVGVDPRVVHGCGLLLGALVRATLDGSPVPPAWARAARAAVSGAEPDALTVAIDPPPVPLGGSTVGSWRGAGGPVVIGFAETATSLGHSVADALGSRMYLHSTRRTSDEVPVAGTFEEGHSHATTHLLLPCPGDALAGEDTMVLVDDEQSTGRTAMAAVEALHAMCPRRRDYLVAALVDLRSPEDRRRMAERARRLGVTVRVVALASGTVTLPPDVLQRAERHLAAHPQPASAPPAASGPVTTVEAGWPAGLRHGGRFGFAGGSGPALATAVTSLADRVRAALPAGARRVLVVGTEELMYLPLRLALALTGELLVRFQSTTRSPVHPELSPGYPVRRRVTFTADDGGARYLYNATFGPPDSPVEAGPGPDPDAVVVVTDDRPGTVVHAVAGLGVPVIAVHVGAERPRPEPLRHPDFGSYRAGDVGWLLTDLSAAELEGTTTDRERRIQSGSEHYAESLPIEYHPGAAYRQLYARSLSDSAERVATAVGLVTELALAERGTDLVLASLARAGTPVGVLMRRWAARRGLDLPHYAVSIVRDRGIDPVALDYLASHHRPESVLFVDGWTGKGAIAVELQQALDEVRAGGGGAFDATIAVLADPGSCTTLYGTREDFLIPSACLNSTVSGLVSRTVLNPRLTSPQQFHGAKFYAELADADVSGAFVDTVAARFDAVAAAVAEQLPPLLTADRRPTFDGMRAVRAVQQRYGLPSVNLVKPGVGETTRVLLRRVPWKVLVRDPGDPAHEHIRLLADERDVAVEQVPDLPYACLGLIRPVGEAT